jgi:drug/metabolite transporter (DMT)-like permease
MGIILAIVVAFLTSVQDIVSKRLLRRLDVIVVTWGWWTFSLVPLGMLAMRERPLIPTENFWPVLGAAAFLVVISVIYYIKALSVSDLSLAVPILNLTPLFLLITSPLMLHESPHPLGAVGVVLIVAGMYLLFYQKEDWHVFAPFRNLLKGSGTRSMLIVAAIFSISGNLDKMGVVLSSPFLWVFWLNLAVSVVLTGILIRDRKSIKMSFVLPLLVLGSLNAFCFLLQMNIIQSMQVPYLIAIKRTSVIFTALYGFTFLKEKQKGKRLLAILLAIAGVFLVALSS